MELFLDVDGVILDFESAFMDFIRDNYLKDLPQGYIPKSWEMTNEFKGVDIEKAWSKFVNSSLFSQLELLVDKNSFNDLSELYSLYLISNIPSIYLEKRITNLKNHALKYKKIEVAGHFDFGEKNYPIKSKAISCLWDKNKKLIFLDDHPDNCLDVKQNFPESQVFLMSRPHNQKAKNNSWIRVNDWDDFLSKLKILPTLL